MRDTHDGSPDGRYRERVLRRLALALVGGLSLVLAFEPVGASYVVPVSVACFVLATVGLPARRAWLPGLVFGIAFCYPLMFWMRVVGYDAWILMSGVEALFLGLLGSVVAVLHRLPAWPVWVATAWVAVEQVRTSWPLSGMPWGRLAYATADTTWAQALPYVGFAGVGFLLALAGSSLAWLVLGPARRQRVAAVATALGALALATLPALVPWTPDLTDHRTVAVVQGNVPGEGDDILLDPRQVTQNHVQATIELADDIDAGRVPQPDFVVWPENSTAVDPFLDAGLNLGIESAVPTRSACRCSSARWSTPAPTHVLNQGIVWQPGVGARRPLHQAPPRAVRRVHPLGAASSAATIGKLRADPARHGERHPHRAAATSGTPWSPTRSASTWPTTTGIRAQVARGARAAGRADLQRDVQPAPTSSSQQFEISRLRARGDRPLGGGGRDQRGLGRRRARRPVVASVPRRGARRSSSRPSG